ncbi:hypothetical protein JXM67_04130 [candidate division WOR-3 bacterium]|nr:hypothetical protein [candidate division WOR-3 bacterium]
MLAVMLAPAIVTSQDVSIRDFVSLGIFYQTLREYYLLPELTGEYWFDSTRTALQWTSNALFDCNFPDEIRNQVEDLRKLLLSKKRSQTTAQYFELAEAISDFADSESLSKDAFECGILIGQLRFYLPRVSVEEDPVKGGLFKRLAEESCFCLKGNFPEWQTMITEYYSRTQGNPLECFFAYLVDTGNLPVENTPTDLKKELVILLEDAAKVLADF